MVLQDCLYLQYRASYQVLIALNAYEKVFIYSLFLPCAKHVNELCAR